MLSHEFIRGSNKNNVFTRMLLKVDLRKAFDYISWEFIGALLEHLNFPRKFVSWRSLWYSVVLNGSFKCLFKGFRGIVQGNRFSPTLLICSLYGSSFSYHG